MNNLERVREFHEKFNVGIGVPIDVNLINLRWDLIDEEAREVYDELVYPATLENIDKKKLTKELADLLYVTYGCAVHFGLPLQEVFEAVHESNMSKLGEDGKPIYREDGKVLKGPNYKEPDLEKYFAS